MIIKELQTKIDEIEDPVSQRVINALFKELHSDLSDSEIKSKIKNIVRVIQNEERSENETN